MKSSNLSIKSALNKKFIFVSLFVIGVFFVHGQFKVEEIYVSGVAKKENGEIQSVLERRLIGKNIFKVGNTQVTGIINSYKPEIKLISLKRKYPSKLIVRVSRRKSIFVISAPAGKYYVDKDFYVLRKSNSAQEGDVNIYYDGVINEHTTITDRALISALLYYAKFNNKLAVQNGKISMITDTIDRVFLPLIKDESKLDTIAGLLQKIIQKYTIEGKDIESVDLRYSDPIIKYR